MLLISFLYRHAGRSFFFAALASLVSGLSGAALIGVISEVVAKSKPYSMMALMFFGACLIYLSSKSAAEITLLNLTQNAIFRLRVSLSHKLIATPLQKLQSMGRDRLLVILTNDVDTFISAFQMLPLAFCNVIVITACLGYMAWLSWQVFIFFTLFLLTSLFAYHFVERRPLAKLIAVREQLDYLYRNFRDLIDGSKELQLNAQRGNQFVEQVLAPAARDYKRFFTRAMTGYIWVQNVGTILFYLVIGALLFVVPVWLPQSTEVLITNTFILLYLIRPITEMMGILPELRRATIALKKIQQLERHLVTEAPSPMGSNPFIGRSPLLLELHGVCHHYSADTEDRSFMIGPLDLTIRQGEVLFIVGGNGSGKTTLAMLLLGLYEVERGTLKLNGVDVTTDNRAAYRQHFSAVFADFHLFEQLLVTEESGAHSRAAHYVDMLKMGHKVKIVNGRFSTIELSTGQRKRLALIASYLEDRPIYLFDEWAADQDPEFKHVFYAELLPELKARGKTVIVITHDDSYFACADRIVKLEDGHLRSVLPQAAIYANAVPTKKIDVPLCD
ncbi:cyclic peptide export ABC transporter [Collimonas pratensis]|uniref:cyclic peptide export ABC transporter n=1 Tax=Collimonas pratensis TaxID=279113 RepID=UPI00143D8323|nr:cyclic peptide export ABC transporter [Collimonas pratensis]NKI71180.1 cyclic peptide export ABC transporter [Collimonas pratensis]